MGSYITGDGVHESLGATWNGTAWTVQATPLLSDLSLLVSVSCTAASACMAVGTSPLGVDETPTPLAERWNGQQWAVQSTPSPAGVSLASVSCESARRCTAVGDVTTGGGQVTLAERWNGTTWAIQPTPGNPAAALRGRQAG